VAVRKRKKLGKKKEMTQSEEMRQGAIHPTSTNKERKTISSGLQTGNRDELGRAVLIEQEGGKISTNHFGTCRS
jgi:hypothetical protein